MLTYQKKDMKKQTVKNIKIVKLGIKHVVAGGIIIPRPFSVTSNKTTFLTKRPPGSSSLTCLFSKCC